MAEFKHSASFNPQGQPNFVTIASGPVIIKDGKVLLDKHGDDFWKFPGGAVESGNSFEENAKREVKEELGVEVELKGEPYIISFTREKDGKEELVILIHYLAEIISGEPQAGQDVVEFGWHDVNSLPADCAPNIKPVVEYFRTLKH
ncbi:MAG: NUDIX domain-containing protein [Patescibacteria group bacterium]|jgi:ADP-ribose pyrophosphatase YjhB (NUDIX family)